MDLSLPTGKRGRKTDEEEDAYYDALVKWCAGIQEIKSTLSFQVGTRGWCYILEAHGLAKSDFDKAEQLLTKCRKIGALPLDICAEDSSRSFVCTGDWAWPIEDMESYVAREIETIKTARERARARVESLWETYTPLAFWETQ